ncbi:MAG: hypothetical protein ACPGED_00770 [Flavobacteriales bacterium]
MKWINTLTLLVLFCGPLASQECDCPDVPIDASWATQKEFEKSEKLVKQSLDWLGENGLNECVSHRESINSYVLLWLSECPYLTVHLQPEALPFLKEYPDLLFVMLHGMADFQLKHPKETNQKLIHAKGLEYLTLVLKNTRRFEGKSDFKKLQKMRRKGKLVEYVETNWK